MKLAKNYFKKYNELWYDILDVHGYKSCYINLNTKMKNKNDVKYFNKWLNYCNNKKYYEISVYMNNPNIYVLNNKLQNVKISNEDIFIRNISIQYDKYFMDLYNKNTEQNNRIKNMMNKPNINNIYGLRNIIPASFYITEYNYDITKIYNICNFTNMYGLKPSYVYNNMEIVNDVLLQFTYDRIYNYKLDTNDIDIVINKINSFENRLSKLYIFQHKCIKKYTLNIFIYSNNIEIIKLYEYLAYKNIMFKCNIYLNNKLYAKNY